MKTLLTAALTVTLASGVLAGNSDRYNDLRFDSAVGHVGDTNKFTSSTPRPTKAILSTSGKKPSGRYADANPYGVGPDNDSR